MARLRLPDENQPSARDVRQQNKTYVTVVAFLPVVAVAARIDNEPTASEAGVRNVIGEVSIETGIDRVKVAVVWRWHFKARRIWPALANGGLNWRVSR